MKISVIGCGRWGSFIGWYLDKIGNNVTVYGIVGTASYDELVATRSNGTLVYPESIRLTNDMKTALESDVIVISVPSQILRSVMEEIKGYSPKDKIYILCMKGLEISTGKRLSEVASEYTSSPIAVWIGPGHPQEFAKGVPNCMVIDSENIDVKKLLVDSFSSSLIRFYYGADLIGNEVGAAVKNVIGIAAGMLDGLLIPSLKGALMSRATKEVYRLIEAMGGEGRSAWGLCHLGDYEATVFSKYSHNRAFGESIVKGEEYTALAEGYYTAQAIHNIAISKKLDLPICDAVYTVLYERADPKETLDSLFRRSIKQEF